MTRPLGKRSDLELDLTLQNSNDMPQPSTGVGRHREGESEIDFWTGSQQMEHEVTRGKACTLSPTRASDPTPTMSDVTLEELVAT